MGRKLENGIATLEAAILFVLITVIATGILAVLDLSWHAADVAQMTDRIIYDNNRTGLKLRSTASQALLVPDEQQIQIAIDKQYEELMVGLMNIIGKDHKVVDYVVETGSAVVQFDENSGLARERASTDVYTRSGGNIALLTEDETLANALKKYLRSSGTGGQSLLATVAPSLDEIKFLPKGLVTGAVVKLDLSSTMLGKTFSALGGRPVVTYSKVVQVRTDVE